MHDATARKWFSRANRTITPPSDGETFMTDTTELMSRIDAEFTEVNARIKQFQTEKTQELQERQNRLEQFAAQCERLQSVWRPRLEALSQRFKERVEVVPSIKKSQRSATIKFHSNLATFNLTFTAMTDADVRHFVVDYTLDILPILMKFEKNKQIEFPLDQVDADALGKWIEDRIVDAVKVYLELHQNAYYLKGHLVRDPITEIEFPRYAAAASVQANGKTYYFISEDSCEAFKREHEIAS